ncbi:hypothetical protein HOY80DRAFT_1086323 [Tuber brumale]|nr:hypothetical protein HOY80DRAFT_1086323 [Tuber brumale]
MTCRPPQISSKGPVPQVPNNEILPSYCRAILALYHHQEYHPVSEREIGNELGIPKSTVHDIIAHTEIGIAKAKTETGISPLDNEKLQPAPCSGRLKKFNEEQQLAIIETATHNSQQRCKSFAMLAKEMPFEIHHTSLAHILKPARYNHHIPRTKPKISSNNLHKRKLFSDQLKDQPVQGYFDGWISTDEMYLVVGDYYGPKRVICKAGEEYHPDCVDLERPGQICLMFWDAIAYGIPCIECPFFVWKKETPEEKELALEMLAKENRIAEEAILEAQDKRYEKEMEHRQAISKG